MSKVMIVDDEASIVWLLQEVVEDLGYEPITAMNGREALQILDAPQSDPPDLIITDVMMPLVNGIEMTQIVKADKRLQTIPVILTSAAGPPVNLAHADLFVHKPFDLDVLAAIITGYIEGDEKSA